MSKANQSTRQTLADHSAAKVSVFTYYLGIYLNILGKVPAVQKAHIFDLMCGEGQYADGRYGSALEGLRRVLAYLTESPRETLKVAYTLNDAGMSDVEKGRRKIDRVQERAERIPFEPVANNRLKITYSAQHCADALKAVITKISQFTPQEKALLFIDPWGYKDIEIADLEAALANGHSEVLLFLPSEMMYRFARKAYHEDFSGGEALQRWLNELFPQALPVFANVHDFINQFRERLHACIKAPYSSRFTLETADHNTYSLFYFTSNRKGLQKMLEAQWKHDQSSGSGHRVEQTFTLFPPAEINDYPGRIERLLAAASRTNEELLEFGLTNGFLPKHTGEVLKKLAGRLQVVPLDGQTVRKNAFYLDNQERNIHFSLTP